jgi:hypothetical protein
MKSEDFSHDMFLSSQEKPMLLAACGFFGLRFSTVLLLLARLTHAASCMGFIFNSDSALSTPPLF